MPLLYAFIFRTFYPRVKRRDWERMEQQATLLHAWFNANNDYKEKIVTICDDIQLLHEYGSLNFHASLITMGGLRKMGAFPLNRGNDAIVLLQDGSIAVRGRDVKHFVRADRTTLSAKRFKEVASVVEGWDAFRAVLKADQPFE